MPTSKIGHFRPKTLDIPLEKSRFLNARQILAWFLAKNDQITSHLFMFLGISACRKTPLGIILSANKKTLTKNFLFKPYPDFIICGLFLCSWSLGMSKMCLRGRFWTHCCYWKLIFVLRSKIDFFQGVCLGFLGENYLFLKSAFFTSLCR